VPALDEGRDLALDTGVEVTHLGQPLGAVRRGIAVAVLLMMLAIRGPAELGSVSVTEFTAQCLDLALLSAFFGALALCVGCFTGRRALLFGATAAVGVVSYALNSFGPQIALGWTRHLSPFHHYLGGEQLKHGFQWADAGVTAAACAVLAGLGAWAFQRRDIGV
jgi:beta-exotoxin I transport system permease protein